LLLSAAKNDGYMFVSRYILLHKYLCKFIYIYIYAYVCMMYVYKMYIYEHVPCILLKPSDYLYIQMTLVLEPLAHNIKCFGEGFRLQFLHLHIYLYL
jgi:hypothetical protein